MSDQSPPVPPGPPATPPPAGWYADPGVAGQLRFWDGRTWTDQVSVPQVTGQVAGAPAGPATHLPPVHVHHSTSTGGFGCAAIVGIVLLSLVLLFAAFVGLTRLVGGGGGDLDEQTAVATCRFHVTVRLQAPDSARFRDLEATEGATEEWTVTGAVESRSAGGTTERTKFVCVVSEGPDGSGVRLDRLRFEGPAPG